MKTFDIFWLLNFASLFCCSDLILLYICISLITSEFWTSSFVYVLFCKGYVDGYSFVSDLFLFKGYIELLCHFSIRLFVFFLIFTVYISWILILSHMCCKFVFHSVYFYSFSLYSTFEISVFSFIPLCFLYHKKAIPTLKSWRYSPI